MALVDLREVIGLQAHIVELDEGEFMLTLQPQLDAIHRQHAVDREMAADVAQEFDVIEPRQPVGVIEQERVAGAFAKAQKSLESRLDRGLVGVDLLHCQQLAALVLAGRIADARGAAADQRQGLAARALEPGQQHDRYEIADMQRGRRAVKADVGRKAALSRLRVEPRKIGALMHKAARNQRGEKFGFGSEIVGHERLLPARRQGRKQGDLLKPPTR